MIQHTEESLQLVLDSVRWNWWFIAAYAIPFALIIPASCIRKWLGFVMIPLAFVTSWCMYFTAIRTVAGALNAYSRATGVDFADTGLAFAPIFGGIPVAFMSTGIAALMVHFARVAFTPLPRDNKKEVSTVDAMASHRGSDDNPYSPPSSTAI